MAKLTMAERLAQGVEAGQASEAAVSAESRDRRARAQAAAEQIAKAQPNRAPGEGSVPSASAQPLHAAIAADQMVEIPLESIQDNPLNPRKFYDLAEIESLASAIAAEGQGVALVVATMADKPGQYRLIDGKRRLLALQRLKRPTAKAVVKTITKEQDLYFYARSLNVERANQTALDDAVSWAELLRNDVVPSMVALAEQLGVDPTTVSSTVAIAELPMSLLTTMSKSPRTSGIAAAREIASFFARKGLDDTQALVDAIVERELSVRQIKELVRAQSEQQPRDRAEPTQRERYLQRAKYRIGGAQIGEIKAYGTGKIELAIVLQDPGQRERVYERISAVLAEEVDKDGG